MKIRKINTFPAPFVKSKKPDLILYADTSSKDSAGLLIFTIDEYVYIFNTDNKSYPLYNEYLKLILCKYPELSFIGYPSKENPTFIEKSDDYIDKYLGDGNYVRIRKGGEAEKNLEEINYDSVSHYIRDGWTADDFKLSKKLKMSALSHGELSDAKNLWDSLPENALVRWNKSRELKELFQFLKQKDFLWTNGQPLDCNHELTDLTQHHLCIDCKDKEIGFISAMFAGRSDLMFFDMYEFEVKKIVLLTMENEAKK